MVIDKGSPDYKAFKKFADKYTETFEDVNVNAAIKAVKRSLEALGTDIVDSSEYEQSADIKAMGVVLGEDHEKLRVFVQKFSSVVAVKVAHRMKAKKEKHLGTRALAYFWEKMYKSLGRYSLEEQEKRVERAREDFRDDEGVEEGDVDEGALAKKLRKSLKKSKESKKQPTPKKKRRKAPKDIESLEFTPDIIARLVGAVNRDDPGLSKILEAFSEDQQENLRQYDLFIEHACKQDRWPTRSTMAFVYELSRMNVPSVLLSVEEVDINAQKFKLPQLSFLVRFPAPLRLDLSITDKLGFIAITHVADEYKILNYLNNELPTLRRLFSKAYTEETMHHFVGSETVDDRGKKTRLDYDIQRQEVVQLRTFEAMGRKFSYAVARFWLDQAISEVPEPSRVIEALDRLVVDLQSLYEQAPAEPEEQEVIAPVGGDGAGARGVQVPTKCPHCGWLLSGGKTTCPRCQKPVLEGAAASGTPEMEGARVVELEDQKTVTEHCDFLDNIFLHLEDHDRKILQRVAIVTQDPRLIEEDFGEAMKAARVVAQWDVQPLTLYHLSAVGVRNYDRVLLVTDLVDVDLEGPAPIELTFIALTKDPLYFNFAMNNQGLFVDDLEPRLEPEDLERIQSRYDDVEKSVGKLYKNAHAFALRTKQPAILEPYPIRAISFEKGPEVQSAVVAKYFLVNNRKGFPDLVLLFDCMDGFVDAISERVPDPSNLAKCAKCGKVLVAPGPLCRVCQAGGPEKTPEEIADAALSINLDDYEVSVDMAPLVEAPEVPLVRKVRGDEELEGTSLKAARAAYDEMMEAQAEILEALENPEALKELIPRHGEIMDRTERAFQETIDETPVSWPPRSQAITLLARIEAQGRKVREQATLGIELLELAESLEKFQESIQEIMGLFNELPTWEAAVLGIEPEEKGDAAETAAEPKSPASPGEQPGATSPPTVSVPTAPSVAGESPGAPLEEAPEGLTEAQEAELGQKLHAIVTKGSELMAAQNFSSSVGYFQKAAEIARKLGNDAYARDMETKVAEIKAYLEQTGAATPAATSSTGPAGTAAPVNTSAGSAGSADDLDDFLGTPSSPESKTGPEPATLPEGASALVSEGESPVGDVDDFLGASSAGDVDDFLGASSAGDVDDFLGASSAGDMDSFLENAAATDLNISMPDSGRLSPPASPPPAADEFAGMDLEAINQEIAQIEFQIKGVQDLVTNLQAAFSAGQIAFEDYQSRTDQYVGVIKEMQDKVARLERQKFKL